jgi:hypothetical protein
MNDPKPGEGDASAESDQHHQMWRYEKIVPPDRDMPLNVPVAAKKIQKFEERNREQHVDPLMISRCGILISSVLSDRVQQAHMEVGEHWIFSFRAGIG